MARPNPTQSAHRSSPRIDEDGDILVSSASSTSSEFDPDFDSSMASASEETSPSIRSKSQAAPSTSHPVASTSNIHTTPTLRATHRKQKVFTSPDQLASPQPLNPRSVPFPVDCALRSALRDGKPVLTAIFGIATVRALMKLAENLSSDLLVSDGEHFIQAAVWKAAAKGLSTTECATLKQAAKKVNDRHQWDRIIREAKETLDPGHYKATVLENADFSCNMVFRLLQML